MGGAVDLTSLDRDVRKAASRVDARDRLLRSPSATAREEARAFDPFEGVRHTSVQATYRALIQLEPAAHEVPLRDALLRWVHELLQVRIAHDLAIAEADAVFAIDPRLERRAREASAERSEGAGGADATDVTDARTYVEAFEALVAAPDDARGARALDRAAELAPAVGAVRREKRERRWEASRRLGLAHPDALAGPADLRGAASALLDATEPLAVEILKRARRDHEGPWRASSTVQLALAKGAREGWPAHLNARWFEETLHALAPRSSPRGPLPAPLGGASFLRAAFRWGFALRSAGAPRTMPFALARDPYPVSANRFGFAIASAIADPVFQRRALGLPSRLAAGQSRHLRTAMFLHVRTLAVRTLFASDPSSTASFEELTARLFGAPLPAPMEGAWPEARASEPARFRALLDAPGFVRDLVDRFDEDWFRNPKAGAHFASIACGPAFDADPPPEGVAASLARAFEEALG